MKQPLKVVFVIKSMGLPGGGAERVLATISRGLEQRGHKLSVISQDPPFGRDYYTVSSHRIRQGNEAGHSRGRLGRLLSWVPRLRRSIISEAPDVAVGFMHSSYLPLAVACLGTGIPVLASEHTVYAHYSSRRVERLLLKATPYLVHAITVVSEQAMRSFPSLLRRKMVVIPNPVQEGRAGEPAAQRKGSLLVAVGRLDSAKDHATLIDAFAQLAHHWPEWDLEIAGEGDCRPQLEHQIASRGLTDRVHLLGAVDIDELFPRADVFAMASRYESFGLATAEALVRGIPAIGFADCSGTNELIKDGINGLLIHPGDNRAGSLASGIRSLFASADFRQRLGANGPASVAQFKEEAILDRWERILYATASGNYRND